RSSARAAGAAARTARSPSADSRTRLPRPPALLWTPCGLTGQDLAWTRLACKRLACKHGRSYAAENRLYPNVLLPGAAVTHGRDDADADAGAAQLGQLTERLRADGVDVIRVSYPDMIGVDRGRDVLLGELPTALEH